MLRNALVARPPRAAGGRAACAQFAHIPGLRVLTPATIDEARYMLFAARADPNPTLIFEHALQYGRRSFAGPVVRGHRPCRDPPPGPGSEFITYGSGLFKALGAAERLMREGIEAEVLGLRTLRPLDNDAIVASVSKTRRCAIIDESWHTGSISTEIGMRAVEAAFFELDAPHRRVCGREVPMPYAAIWKTPACRSPRLSWSPPAISCRRHERLQNARTRGGRHACRMACEAWRSGQVRRGDPMEPGARMKITPVARRRAAARCVARGSTGRSDLPTSKPGARVPAETPSIRRGVDLSEMCKAIGAAMSRAKTATGSRSKHRARRAFFEGRRPRAVRTAKTQRRRMRTALSPPPAASISPGRRASRRRTCGAGDQGYGQKVAHRTYVLRARRGSLRASELASPTIR